MITKPYAHESRCQVLHSRQALTRHDAVWMMGIGLFGMLTPAILGLDFISPAGAVIWTILGLWWLWWGIKTLREGAKRVDVIGCIKTGRANAVSRAQLVVFTGLHDRAVRKKIEQYRNSGIPIMSASDGQGYWVAETVEEVERFLREADNRARAQRYIRLRQMVAAAKGDRLVPVKQHYRRLKSYEVDGQVGL